MTPLVAKNQTRVLSAQYFLYFGVLGVVLPFFNLYCYHLGFSEEQIGAISGVRSAAVVCMPLLWGVLADRFQARRGILVFCNVVSTLVFAGYFFFDTFWPMLAITAVYAFFQAPVISFMEAFSMEILGRNKNKYGRVRVWGSLSFIAMVLGMGRVMEALGARIILPVILAGSTVQAAFSTALPKTEKRRLAGNWKQALAPFFTSRVVVFQLAALCMLASHGAYYGFFSIHLEKLGYSEMFIGVAWALATLAEVGVMAGSHRVLGRFSPRLLIFASCFLAAGRWGLLALVDSAWVILVTQLLHAGTYGAFHVASIVYMEQLIPAESRTLGQAVNNAMTYGLGMTAGFFLAGYLFQNAGAMGAFGASAALAAGGGLLFGIFTWKNRYSAT